MSALITTELPRALRCALCGCPLDDADGDRPFCEDCEPSDCAYCGRTTPRALLSEHLACLMCEGDGG